MQWIGHAGYKVAADDGLARYTARLKGALRPARHKPDARIRPSLRRSAKSDKQRKRKQDCRYGGEPYQPHPGTQCHRCGCSLPGLTGFTADRCEGTGRAHHNKTRLAASGAIVPAYQQLTTTDYKLRVAAANCCMADQSLPPVSNWQNRQMTWRIASKASSQRPASVRG